MQQFARRMTSLSFWNQISYRLSMGQVNKVLYGQKRVLIKKWLTQKRQLHKIQFLRIKNVFADSLSRIRMCANRSH